MIRFVTATALLALSFVAQAQLRMGVEMGVVAPICMTRESAVEIASTDVEKGLPAAIAVFNAKDDCNRMPVRMRAVRIVLEAPTKADPMRIVRVVEVQARAPDASMVTVYLLTDGPVQGPPIT